MADHIQRDLDMLQRPAQLLGDFLDLPRLEQLQMIGNDLPGHAALAVAALDLQQQAFPHVLGADARRIERLHDPQAFLHFLHRMLAGFGDLFERGREIAVLVQVADDVVRRVAHLLRHHQHAQLRMQMIGQRDGRGKKGLKRRLLDRLRCRALVAGIQIIVEKGSEIDLVERIFFGFLLGDLAFGRAEAPRRRPARQARHRIELRSRSRRCLGNSRGDLRLRARAVHRLENHLIGWLGDALGLENRLHFFRRQLLDAVHRFFENRILGDLLRDHVLQLQPVQLKDRHHLDQAGCEDLLLRDFQLQSGRKHRHL